MRCKIFSGYRDTVEHHINTWLNDATEQHANFKVAHIAQTRDISENVLTITVFYTF